MLAKGYEYTAEGLPAKTSEEAEALRSYGGDILFTPGDIVYSSSRLIEMKAPNLSLEKLQLAMERSGAKFDDLRRTIDRLSSQRVHIVGDTIVDSYTQCAMIGGLTKTPTMSVLFESRKDYVGGAAIVAKHCRAAGAAVEFSTVLGEDALADFVVDDLKACGVEVKATIDRRRPTVNKNAVVVGGYRLLKIDTLDNTTISDSNSRGADGERARDEGGRRRLFRLPAWHIQPTHDSGPHRGDPATTSSASPTVRSQAAGATSPNSAVST